MARKWIIENKVFKYGIVECHAELSSNGWKSTRKEVSGGGLFHVDDKDKNIIYLYGRSIDFGNCTVKDIKECEFHFRWDKFTIKFTLISDLNIVLGMDDEDFEFIRKPIKDELEVNS